MKGSVLQCFGGSLAPSPVPDIRYLGLSLFASKPLRLQCAQAESVGCWTSTIPKERRDKVEPIHK